MDSKFATAILDGKLASWQLIDMGLAPSRHNSSFPCCDSQFQSNHIFCKRHLAMCLAFGSPQDISNFWSIVRLILGKLDC